MPFSVRDGTGVVTPLPAGELVLKPELKVVVDGQAEALPGPLAFVPGKGGTLTLDGKGYRGELRATAIAEDAADHRRRRRSTRTCWASSRARCPRSGPPAALQAQAVAARSYALASLVKNRAFDLYSDPRSQVYYGVARGVAGDDRRREGDARRDPHLRREGRDDVLLLVLGRPHRIQRGRLRAA